MSEKNCHYKLDFKVKDNKSGKNLTFKDFRPRYFYSYHYGYNCPTTSSIVEARSVGGNYTSLVPSDFDLEDCLTKLYDKCGIQMTHSEKTFFPLYVSLGKAEFYKKYFKSPSNHVNQQIGHSTLDKYYHILVYLATTTPEFQTYEAAFQKWLLKRPGLLDVWNKKNNDKSPNLMDFANLTNDRDFRNLVENSRPRNLKIGTLVQLNDRYLNNSGKDPFYWHRDLKQTPRLGMISKLNETNAFGYGSRLLKIMWIATSEETTLMERDLKILSE